MHTGRLCSPTILTGAGHHTLLVKSTKRRIYSRKQKRGSRTQSSGALLSSVSKCLLLTSSLLQSRCTHTLIVPYSYNLIPIPSVYSIVNSNYLSASEQHADQCWHSLWFGASSFVITTVNRRSPNGLASLESVQEQYLHAQRRPLSPSECSVGWAAMAALSC